MVEQGWYPFLDWLCTDSPLLVCKLGSQRLWAQDPTDVAGWLYCSILHKGLVYPWILLSAGGPGTNPLQLLKDDCMYTNWVKFVRSNQLGVIALALHLEMNRNTSLYREIKTERESDRHRPWSASLASSPSLEPCHLSQMLGFWSGKPEWLESILTWVYLFTVKVVAAGSCCHSYWGAERTF